MFFSRRLGQAEKARTYSRTIFAIGTTISKLSHPENPAFAKISQNGTITRTAITNIMSGPNGHIGIPSIIPIMLGMMPPRCGWRQLAFPPSIDGVGTGVIVEGLQQQAIEPDLSPGAELVDPDDHALVSGRRFCTVCAKQPVPPSQGEAEVAVGFGRIDGVVQPMHVRSHHEPAQYSVHRRWDANVRVAEHQHGIEHDFKHQDGQHRRAQHEDDRELDRYGQSDLHPDKEDVYHGKREVVRPPNPSRSLQYAPGRE